MTENSLGPTQEEMVEAYEHAMRYRQEFPEDSNAPIEPMMVMKQAGAIDQVQTQQNRARMAQRQAISRFKPPSVMDEIEEYRQDQAKQELQDAMMEYWQALADGAQQLIQALGVSFQEACDAIIAAMKPFQDLLDQTESLPSQPVCPSHGRALIGGTCLTCQRGNMRQTRSTGR